MDTKKQIVVRRKESSTAGGIAMTQVNTDGSPRIFAASMADHRAGRIHGQWISADQSASAFRAEVNQMLFLSMEPKAEEWAIHDYQGFAGVRLGLFEPIELIVELALRLRTHGEVFGKLLEEHFRGVRGLANADFAMETQHVGSFSNLDDFARSCLEPHGDVLLLLPDFLSRCVTPEKVGRELVDSHYIYTVETSDSIHVFRYDR